MTSSIALVLSILGIAIILFISERIRVDVVAMLVLLALLLTGTLTTDEAFSGFANPAVITVWSIYIVSAALTRTGIADFIGQRIMRVAGTSEQRLVAVIMVTVGIISAFMNNIGATAVLLPAVVSVGRRARVPVSKLLIPLAFGSLLGGVTTLIGTPPNLLVSAALANAGFQPFSLFDYTPMGLIIMISSIIYMVFIGRHLLPRYTNTDTTDLVRQYQLQDHLTELEILPDSPLIGKTLVESKLGEKHAINVVGIIRNSHVRLGMMPNAHIHPGDVLLVHGAEPNFPQVDSLLGVTSNGKATLQDADLSSPEAAVSEVVISQKADFIGKTLSEIDFRSRYGLTVLAVRRYDKPVLERLYEDPLHLGDTLLVHGRRERINALQKNSAFLLLNAVETEPRRLGKAPLALIIFVCMITLVATGRLHISTAAVTASILLVLVGAIKMDEAYKAIEWQSVFLIAGMLPMGIAMEKTGAAQFLSDSIIHLVGGLGPKAIMVGLFVLTTVITEFMSNAAAAVLVAPIAISAALSLGVDPRAFVMGVGIAASNSFLFPIGHQSSVLVYGPGNYRFFDYAKVGLPLTLLIWMLMIIFLPIFWPL